MKEFSRRLLALMLVLTMVFSLAVAVSASTVSWNGSDGLYTLTTSITSRSVQQTKAATNAPQVGHNGSTATYLAVKVDHYANFSASIKGAYTPYQTYMDQVLRKDSAALSKKLTSGTVGTITVPASASSGYYKVAIVAVGLKGSYVINLGSSTNRTITTQGTVLSNSIIFAPISKSGIGYIKVS